MNSTAAFATPIILGVALGLLRCGFTCSNFSLTIIKLKYYFKDSKNGGKSYGKRNLTISPDELDQLIELAKVSVKRVFKENEFRFLSKLAESAFAAGELIPYHAKFLNVIFWYLVVVSNRTLLL
jgi:hypothetical protein